MSFSSNKIKPNNVDLSSAQTLENKAIKDPSQTDVYKDTLVNLQAHAVSGDGTNGQFCFDIDNNTMYQIIANVLIDMSATSGLLERIQALEGFPTIVSSALDPDNLFIDVTMDGPVYNATGGTGALEATDFGITFAANGGTATDTTISGVTNTSDTALIGGETTIRVTLTVTGTPDGAETIEITPVDGNSIFNIYGNPMDASETTGTSNLNIPIAPAIFFDDFESGDFVTGGWTVVNSSPVVGGPDSGKSNHWVVNSGIANTLLPSTGVNSMYITKDDSAPTPTFDYWGSNVTTVSSVYIDIDLTGYTTSLLEFDYISEGESTFDYCKVIAGTGIPAPVLDTTYVVGGALEYIIPHPTALTPSDFVAESIDLTAYAGGIVRIIFEWRNDFSVGDFPVAIDNVKITGTV